MPSQLCESKGSVCVCVCVCARARVCAKLLHIQLFATPWTVAHQSPLSMGFSRQEYWSGLPFPAPGNLPNPGIEPASVASPALQADSLPLSHWGSPTSSLSRIYSLLTQPHLHLVQLHHGLDQRSLSHADFPGSMPPASPIYPR